MFPSCSCHLICLPVPAVYEHHLQCHHCQLQLDNHQHSCQALWVCLRHHWWQRPRGPPVCHPVVTGAQPNCQRQCVLKVCTVRHSMVAPWGFNCRVFDTKLALSAASTCHCARMLCIAFVCKFATSLLFLVLWCGKSNILAGSSACSCETCVIQACRHVLFLQPPAETIIGCHAIVGRLDAQICADACACLFMHLRDLAMSVGVSVSMSHGLGPAIAAGGFSRAQHSLFCHTSLLGLLGQGSPHC
jgi:hypothetical protein